MTGLDTACSPGRVTVPQVATPDTDTAPSLWLPLQSGLNLRDVGGLPVGAGGVIRPGVLLRGGSLRLLSVADADRLRTEFDLRIVVDLRTSAELAADGPSLLAGTGLATAHLPLIDNIHDDLRDAQRSTDPVRMLAGAYHQFVARRGEHIATASTNGGRPPGGSAVARQSPNPPIPSDRSVHEPDCDPGGPGRHRPAHGWLLMTVNAVYPPVS